MRGEVQIRASRPVYRRGGLAFTGGQWLAVDAETLSLEQSLALLQDPVLAIQVRAAEGEDWRTLTPPERAEIAEGLRGAAAFAVELADAVAARLSPLLHGDGTGVALPPIDRQMNSEGPTAAPAAADAAEPLGASEVSTAVSSDGAEAGNPSSSDVTTTGAEAPGPAASDGAAAGGGGAPAPPAADPPAPPPPPPPARKPAGGAKKPKSSPTA